MTRDHLRKKINVTRHLNCVLCCNFKQLFKKNPTRKKHSKMFVISPVKILLVAVLTVTISIKDVSAIKCYQCNSAVDIGCDLIEGNQPEKFAHFYKECEGKYEGHEPFCRKIEFELLDREIEEQRILRICGWIPSNSKRSCREFTTDNHFQMECECHDDGCNASTRLKTSLIVTLASFILVLIFSNGYSQ
uniref:Putative membrane protein n=2 Tax=Nyssomyia neivai TaxID=330878 RepID=A0A1L8DA02_9DIPT